MKIYNESSEHYFKFLDISFFTDLMNEFDDK